MNRWQTTSYLQHMLLGSAACASGISFVRRNEQNKPRQRRRHTR